MDKLNKAHDDGVVLGLADVAGVAQRLDIDVMLLKQPDTFNLFIIALLELQGRQVPWKVDPGYTFTSADKISFFQLAGIHGLPHEDWDGVAKPPLPQGDKASEKPFKDGYCAHATPAFPCWHRPYLALLEQTLFRQVANVAKRFSKSPDVSDEVKQAYTAAAKKFRLPYWDYYRPRGYEVTIRGVAKEGSNTTTLPFDYRAPQILTLPEVMVKRLPDKKLISVANPFFQFEFSSEDSARIDWKHSQLDKNGTYPEVKNRTLRHGGSKQANTDEMNELLNKIREDEMRCSLVMIEEGAYSNFDKFASSGASAGQKWKFDDILKDTTGSIEALHGDYHSYIGGFSDDDGNNTGHMSCVPVAAFDVAFFTHHTQIDRLYAIWQASNGEEQWFNETQPKKQYLGEFPLTPFRRGTRAVEGAEQEFWNPTTARDTTVFGYTYPETQGRELGRDAGQADQVRSDFARQYAWSRRLDVNQNFDSPPEDMMPLPVETAQVFQYTDGVESAGFLKKVGIRVHPRPKLSARMTAAPAVAETALPTPKVSQEWYIDVVVERMAANGSYTIFYIIGDIEGQTGKEWSTLPGFAGVSHIFTAPREACDNCGRQEEQALLVTSTTPITSLLLDYVEAGQLGSMDPHDVEPFLVGKLKWRVQSVGGTVIDPRDLDKDHTLKLGISLKTAPMPGQQGTVEYSFFPQIIEQIISNAS